MSNFELFLDFQKQVLTYSFMSLNKKRAPNESGSWFSGAQKKILVECDHFYIFPETPVRIPTTITSAKSHFSTFSAGIREMWIVIPKIPQKTARKAYESKMSKP